MKYTKDTPEVLKTKRKLYGAGLVVGNKFVANGKEYKVCSYITLKRDGFYLMNENDLPVKVADPDGTITVLVSRVKRFFKRPQKGDKVKVYYEDNTVSYGIVRGLDIVRADHGWKREIAILKKRDFLPFGECHYFLDECKIRFE